MEDSLGQILEHQKSILRYKKQFLGYSETKFKNI